MSIRLDPRRVNALKHLAGEAGVRPGDLVRQWVEERIDAARTGAGGASLADTVDALVARVAALEAAAGIVATVAEPASPEPEAEHAPEPEPESESESAREPHVDAIAEPEPAAPEPEAPKRARRNAVVAAPTERVALHDEMITLIRERGPMTAAELAGAIAERGRYVPPRSGKALDAAMVSQRVSNPAYRSRFTRVEGRIGLAEGA